MFSEMTISNLPKETLVDLLLVAGGELLEAMEKKDLIAIRAKQKQVDIIYSAIKKWGGQI